MNDVFSRFSLDFWIFSNLVGLGYGSPSWIRTSDHTINSRELYR